MAQITATWNIELNCKCQNCTEYVDLLSYPDFWDGRGLEFGEHNTDRSLDMNVVCPECGHEFEVDCEY